MQKTPETLPANKNKDGRVFFRHCGILKSVPSICRSFQVHKIDDGIYSTPSAAASSSAGPSKAKSKQKQHQPPKMNPGVQDEIIAGGVQVEPVAPQQGRGRRPKRSAAAKPVNYTEDEVYATPPQTGAGRRRK